MSIRLLTLIALFLPGFASGQEPWATYRGNPQRTGSTDGKPGPASPKVLWVFKSQEHFVASPVPSGDEVLFSGLGAFNRPNFLALGKSPKNPVEPVWTKSTPYLKLPTVSSPAIAGNVLIFGDGMHQTDGAILHCIPAGGGLPLWQLPVPGNLVHLEGSPTVAGNKVYMGGGAAGVMCVEWNKASLDGKEYDLLSIQKMQAEKWKKLAADYEVEKKKDPDFATPPSEEQLLKFAPKLVWQQGKEKWHVDAPVNVADGKVFVCSAFLDKEKVGDRAVHCLDAETGKSLWRAPLTLNPWGGVSVSASEGVAVVSTSSTNYDTKNLKGAKGEVFALNLGDGSVKWKKDFPGGVLGCVALTKELAVFTCTDGKVRALTLKDGERRVLYDAKSPIFAPPAVSGDTAYVADLKGIVHAIDLKSGTAAWTLDLSADPVSSPGMVYGGVLVHGGNLYLGTCNLEGAFAGKPTAIVCIGNK